nr:MAG TPA: hypothetical protein [Caudoviricetes sp.]
MTLQIYWRMTAGCTRNTRCRCLYGGSVIYANAYCLLDREEKDMDIRKACYNMSNDTLTVYATNAGIMNYERSFENERPKR